MEGGHCARAPGGRRLVGVRTYGGQLTNRGISTQSPSSTSMATTTHVITFSTTDTTVDTAWSCHSSGGLPDASCTPGAVDPTVNQDNIGNTICVSGYSSSVRPSTSYTAPRKISSILVYGFSDTNPSDYEYDHLISLELGGSPTDTRNLWPEPHFGEYTSTDKDGFENFLHRHICDGTVSLAQAQFEISTDWVSYWISAGRP